MFRYAYWRQYNSSCNLDEIFKINLSISINLHILKDISYKLKRASSQVQRTSITPDAPWKLQQVQDAANHLQQAINHIDNVDGNYAFKYVSIICVHIPIICYL